VSRSKVGRTSRGPAGKPGGTRDNPPHPEARPWPERGASAADRRAEVRRGPRRSAGGGVKAHPVGRRGGGRWERGQATPVGAERRRAGVGARGHRLAARRRVKRHGGRPGMAGRRVGAWPGSRREPGPRRRAGVRAGTSRPRAGTRVELPPPGGGVRPRGLAPGRARVGPQAGRPGRQPRGAPPVAAGRAGQGGGAPRASGWARGGREPERRATRPRRTAGLGPRDAGRGAAPEAGGQRRHTGGGPPVAAPGPGRHVHGASAAPPPGAREGPRGVPARGRPPPVPAARGVTRARRGRGAAVPRRGGRRLGLDGRTVARQGAGRLGPPAVARLPGAAGGAASRSGRAPAWGEPSAGLAPGPSRAWAVAVAPPPSAGPRPPGPLR